MARALREMLIAALAESESLIKKVLLNIITAAKNEERWPENLGGSPKHNQLFKGSTHT